MYEPISNTLSLEKDAKYAAELMTWQQELDQECAKLAPTGPVIFPNPLRGKLLNCQMQIEHATEITIRSVFRYNNTGRLCLTQ